MAKTSWEVIVLREAGIENAVYMLEGPMAADPIARRTLLAMTKGIVCPFDPDGNGPIAAQGLIDHFGERSENLRVMPVLPNGGVLRLLATGGPIAVRVAMEEAVPFHQRVG